MCSGKPGNKLFKQWASIWEQEAGGSGLPPKISQFMADMWLPIYVQCTNEGCGQWRKLPAHIELHHVKLDLVKCNDCSIPEDQVGVDRWVWFISAIVFLYNRLLEMLKIHCGSIQSVILHYYDIMKG